MTPPDPNPQQASAGELLGGVITDAKDLVVAHGERIKLEIRDELRGLKTTIKLVGIAVAAVAVAAILAGQAVALGLASATGLPAWVAYAIVAVVATVAGDVVLSRRPPTEQIDLVPESSLRDAKRDAKMVADAIRH